MRHLSRLISRSPRPAQRMGHDSALVDAAGAAALFVLLLVALYLPALS